MYEIFLINMPFAPLDKPSIALTQLKSVVERQHKDQVSVTIFYLNHEFSHYIGLDLYRDICSSMQHQASGLGDWLFSQSAFPDSEDNSEEYFLRYYPQQDGKSQQFKQLIREKRQGLDHLLDALIDQYGLDQANLVGLTSMFAQNVACLAMVRKLKARNPALTITMGGANCEYPMGREIVKHVEQIDFVFSGPALKSFSQFVEYQLSQELEKCHTIYGVFSKENLSRLRSPAAPGELMLFGESPSIGTLGEELDVNAKIELDYDDFLDSVEKNFPNNGIEPVLLFETSRGCWWGERAHCTFCGLNGLTMNYRAMSPDRALEQFHDLFKYAPRVSSLECVDNILPKSYLKEVFPLLDAPANIVIFYEVKSDLSEKDLQVLSGAHVKIVQPGIEALATFTLKLMRKGSTAFQNLSLLKNCVMYDVFPYWNLLVGFPGEDEDVYKKYIRDIPLLMHLPPPYGPNPVRFDRFSPYFAHPEAYELDLHPFDFYTLAYPFSQESLANLAYYFMDHNRFNADYFLKMARWIHEIGQKVERWRSRWNTEDPDLRPNLFHKKIGGGPAIHDSRLGEVMVYEISPVSQQILEHLTQPTSLPKLASKLNHILNFDVDEEIAFLQDRGLVFEERGRFISLVLPHQPPEMTIRRAGE